MGKIRFLAAIALAAFMTIFMGLTVFAEVTAYISADTVNIRTSPNLTADVVAKLNGGDGISLLDVSGEWVKISYQGKECYVFAEYVRVAKTQGLISESGVNVREQATTSANILGQLSSGDTVNILGSDGEFFLIEYKNANAFVHKNFVVSRFGALVGKAPAGAKTQNPAKTDGEMKLYAIVDSVDGLNLRQGASTDSPVIMTLPNRAAADLIRLDAEWHQVSYNGQTGYLNAAFVEVYYGEKPQATSARGEELVAFAKQFLGTPYRYAGTDLRKGVDCSGFTYSVYKNFGITLNRSSRDQYQNGTQVNKSDLLPGDLLFFNAGGSGGISHVGIYMGGGYFIHSSTTSTGVIISSLSENYNVRSYVGARRIFN